MNKKPKTEMDDELRPEYDLPKALSKNNLINFQEAQRAA